MIKNSVFLLLGPENGEKDKFIDSIKRRIADSTGEEPEIHRFYPFETNACKIISLLKNGSLFSSHKLVFLNEAQEIKKEDAVVYAEYAKKPADNTTLIFKSSNINIIKTLSAAVPAGNKKIFWELFENQKRSWIIGFLKKADIKIEHEAIELILEMVDNNTDEMKKVCEKLLLFFGKGSEISFDDVEKFIYHSKEENVFTLFEPIASGSLLQALEILQKICLAGETHPVQLFAGLLYQFRKMHNLSELTARQYSMEEAFKKLKINGKKNQKIFSAGTRLYSHEDLKRIIVMIARYDAEIRTLKTDIQNLPLQMFIYYCIVKKGIQPERFQNQQSV